jgi:hypothetical protein
MEKLSFLVSTSGAPPAPRGQGTNMWGSSSQLAVRLNGYFKEKHRAVGKLVPLLKGGNLSNFTLEVILLNNNYEFRSEIVLEQYYLLDPSFNLNTVRVANNPSGSNAKLVIYICPI